MVTRYLDGRLPDEIKYYQVLSGESFLESYEVLPGYELAGASVRLVSIVVDGKKQTIAIEGVDRDYTVMIYLQESDVQ